MTNFDLLELIGQVDEGHLEQSDSPKGRVPWRRWGTLAACLLLMLGATALWSWEGVGETAPSGSQTETAGPIREEMVDVEDLLYVPGEGEFTQEVLVVRQIPLGAYTAEYHHVEIRPQANLENSRGEELRDAPGWYRLRGHEDLQYLIGPDGDDTLALWEFAYLVPPNEEEREDFSYPYRTVLEEVYCIFSAQDILQITVSPGNMDNTDEGKAAQEEIGAFSLTDRADISALYEAMASAVCLGPDLWGEIQWGHQSGHSLVQAVRNTRYLTLELADGRTMDHLKYTAGGHQFYEYSGVAYEPLEMSVAQRVEAILRIT